MTKTYAKEGYARDRKRTASNTFTAAELRGMIELLALVRRGGDALVVSQSPIVVNLERKFHRMLTGIETRASLGEPEIQEVPPHEMPCVLANGCQTNELCTLVARCSAIPKRER